MVNIENDYIYIYIYIYKKNVKMMQVQNRSKIIFKSQNLMINSNR